MKRVSAVVFASWLSGIPHARADEPVLRPPPLALAPIARPATSVFSFLGPAGEPTGNAGGLPPSLALQPLRLSLTSTVFPIGSAFPQCDTRGDDVGNSNHGVPVQRSQFVLLAPRLTLHVFSTGGCPIDGGLGAGLTYAAPLRPSLWLVAGAGVYGIPAGNAALPARSAADLRVDLVKETTQGKTLHIGIDHKSGTGTEHVPVMVTFGGSF